MVFDGPIAEDAKKRNETNSLFDCFCFSQIICIIFVFFHLFIYVVYLFICKQKCIIIYIYVFVSICLLFGSNICVWFFFGRPFFVSSFTHPIRINKITFRNAFARCLSELKKISENHNASSLQAWRAHPVPSHHPWSDGCLMSIMPSCRCQVVANIEWIQKNWVIGVFVSRGTQSHARRKATCQRPRDAKRLRFFLKQEAMMTERRKFLLIGAKTTGFTRFKTSVKKS